MIRNLISAWVLALVGSLFLPLASPAAVSGTTYSQLSATTTIPAIFAEHASVAEMGCSISVGLQSMASSQAPAPFSFGRSLVAPKSTTQVTSWADEGITPDLDPGRWVMKGGPTKANFWKSGLPGPKVVRTSKFPFFRIQRSRADFTNFITREVPTSSLKLPPGPEVIKAPLGQRVLKGGE